MQKPKPHIGISLIALFYLLLAIVVFILFTYTYIITNVSVINRIFGIMLGSVLGFSIFYIGFGVWKGHAWAQLVVIVVSGIIVLFNVIAYITGRVVTLGSAIYFITVLIINVLIIQYLLGKNAKKHFHQDDTFKDAINRVIKKHYEKHCSDNKK